MVKIKSDLHIHTSDEKDEKYIKHSAKDVIDKASSLKYGAIAITLHDKVRPAKDLKKYASSKGILLIQGVEATIERRHTLIYNITPEEFRKIKTFNDLRKLKRKNKEIFVIAPHPFNANLFPNSLSLRNKYFKNRDLFDAMEIHPNGTWFYDLNKKTRRVASADGKPLVANTDLHFLSHFGKNYSVVDVKGKINEHNFFDAIRKNRTTLVSERKSTLNFLKTVVEYIIKIEL